MSFKTAQLVNNVLQANISVTAPCHQRSAKEKQNYANKHATV